MTETEKTESKVKKSKKTCRTYIGGQAVLEGVMMMGKTCQACAVRDEDGNIQIEAKRLNRGEGVKKASKIPFVRGIVNLFSSLVTGTKVLMRSAAVYGDDDEEESGKVSQWLAEKMKLSVMDVISIVSVVLGLALAIGIFVFIPNLILNFFCDTFPAAFVDNDLAGLWTGLLLGGIKMIIFIAYLALILLLKDIRRLYQYHGAEHKTINAYEHGMNLVPGEVKNASRIHDRCGTSFTFIVLIINIFVFSVVSWLLHVDKATIPNGVLFVLARIGLEIVLLPVITGISYEFLKLFARFDNKFVNIFKAPGMLLQKALTTREPDEQQLEVAIAAFNKVLEMDADPEAKETEFITSGILSKMLAKTKEKFKAENIDESDAEWIYSIVLGVNRSDLNKERNIKPSETRRIAEIEAERLTGRPLWYIIGDTDFYGCKIKVDERALIPRPETEQLAELVVKTAEKGNKILDMCTGSGCVAISVAKACKEMEVTVTASDVSDAAIMLAKENAALNEVDVKFVTGDLFRNVHGRFDIIVCNPPYVKSGDIPNLQKEVRLFEPRVALDGGADGMEFYRRLAAEVRSYMRPGGILVMECGEGQTEEILKLFKKRDYAMVIKDLAGVERFVKIMF